MEEKQSKIKSLKFPEIVRQMPYMLLGDLNDSSILLREIFDNSRDELIASQHCDTIYINTDEKNSIYTVVDNGRGIPTELSEDEPDKTQMHLALGSVYAGGKYDSDVVAGGMHGVGSSAVNAVSNVFKAACKIRQEAIGNSIDIVNSIDSAEGKYLFYEWNKGILVRTEVLDSTDLTKEFGEGIPTDFSTYVGFTPDETIVKSTKAPISPTWYEYTFEVMKRFFNKDIHIIINGVEVEDSFKPYKYWVQKTYPLRWPGKNKEISLLINWEFDADLSTQDYSGCVNMITCNRGKHIEIASWIITHNLRTVFSINHKYIHQGLKFNVILLAKKVGYNSQTKEKLATISDFYDDDWYQLDEEVKKIYNDNYDEIWKHVQRLNEYAESMQNIATKDYIKRMVNVTADQNQSKARSYVPWKVKDCSTPNREEAELYLVEGESAGGSLISTRDIRTQAVMGLRGKSMNTTYKTLEDIFENEEIKDIISAIGTGVDEYYDLSAVRYGKIIIAADADCFHGSTKVRLVDGRVKTLQELATEYPNGGIQVFSYDLENQRVVPGTVTSCLEYAERSEMLKIYLDNGETEICTPEHKWMLRNGSYIEAKDLKRGDSLNCLWIKEGMYPLIWQDYEEAYKYLHREFCIEKSKEAETSIDTQVHHKNKNTQDNRPENLILLTRSEHARLHITEYNQSEERIDYIKQLHKEGVYKHTYFGENGWNGSEEQKELLRYYHRYTDRYDDVHENIISYNKSEEHKETVRKLNRDSSQILLQVTGRYMKKIDKLVSRDYSIRQCIEDLWKSTTISEYFNSIEEVLHTYELYSTGMYLRFKIVADINEWIADGWDLQDCIDWIVDNNYRDFSTYFKDKEDLMHEYKLHNHKIVDIGKLEGIYKTYCLTVDGYKNFALASGAFVHNCDGAHIAALLLGLFAYHMSYLIENGFVYILVSPLYEQNGVYIYPGEEDKLDKSKPFERFKGLGSLESDETRHRVLTNKETRRLVRVTIDGIQDAISCVGDKYFRKQMMVRNGFVKEGYPEDYNLDK